MEIELIENIERLSEIEREWNDLLEGSAQGDIFLLPQWFSSWWEIYGKGKNLYTIALWKDRVLCGLLLLYKIKKGPFRLITFAGYPRGSDQMDFILMNGMEDECLAVFIKWLYERSDWDMVAFRDFGPFSGNPEILSNIVIRQGERCHVSKELPSYYLSLNDFKDFDSYLNKTMSKKKRSKMRLKRNSLSRLKDVKWELLDGIDEKTVDEMKELDTVKSSRGLKGISAFSNPEKGPFLKRLSKEKINSENIILFCLRIKGKLAAYQLNFKYRSRLLDYQKSFDREYYRLSLGVQIMYRLIEYAFKEGYNELDFLKGDESYKKDYSEAFRENRRVHFYRRGFKASILYIYHGKLKPLRTKLKKYRLLTVLFPARLRRKWDI